MAELKELISEKEMAKALGVGRSVLYGLRRKGLPHLRIGQTVFYRESDFVEWLLAHCKRSLD